MTIQKTLFATLQDRAVDLYTIRNANGLEARLISFGARLIGMDVPDRHGNFADVVLGFDDLADYVATDHYYGASCGRYGNRIREGRFELEGQALQVSCNEGGNHLHGGFKGFDKYIWEASADEVEGSVTFTLASPHGSEGFPGNLLISTRYTLGDDNVLSIVMTGTTDRPTILNMVHHSFWNMGGHDSGDIRDHMLEIAGDFYTPVGEGLLATGEIHSVAGTPFDFREAKPIGRDLDAVSNAGVAHLTGGGYDHNWVLRGFGPGQRPVARLWDPASGRGLALTSSEPGVHVYTGGYIKTSVVGKDGKPYRPYAGLTFETQKFPDSPNFAQFESARLEPDQVYRHVMAVRFFTT